MIRGWIKLMLGSSLLVAFLWVGSVLYLRFETRRKAKTHLVEYTRQELRNVLLGLSFRCEVEKKQPWPIVESQRTVTGREIFSALSQSTDAVRLCSANQVSLARNAFCDRWGDEIHAKLNIHGNQMHVTLWSNGPNHVDEQGNGDDITEQCDITVPEGSTARELQSSSMPQMITSNLVSDVKNKTGVDLPMACKLILSTNSPRLDCDTWLFKMDGNAAQFPRQLELQPQSDARNTVKVMERMGGISIGIPEAWYFGIWQASNAQCHATLVTTSNSNYLMLERLY
jgi:hypothetical protein